MLGRHVVLALVLALAVSACTSIKVTGFVTDQTTGEPVSGCGVSLGSYYASTDAAGHFTIKGRRHHDDLHLIAAGYERKTVIVDSSQTRYPVVNVVLTPRSSTLEGVGSGPPAEAD